MILAQHPFRILILGILTVLIATATNADIFDVTHLGDSGAESLRQAIIDANANPGLDTILFDTGLSGTIELQSGLPSLSEQADLIGPGATQLIVDANSHARVLNLHGSTLDSFIVSGLTLTGGNSVNFGGAGIALRAWNSLLLEDVHLYSNVAGDSIGGGFYAETNTDVIIRKSILSHNRARKGGGIYSNGKLTVEFSTLHSNVGDLEGGAIWTNDSLVLTESTLDRNLAPGDLPAIGFGGGINLYSGAILEAYQVTISNNSADVGPGINRWSGSSVSHIGNSIIAYNHYSSGTLGDCSGSLEILDEANLSSDTSCGFFGGSDFEGVDPELLSLAWAGGPTPTLVPKRGSPAIDVGHASNCFTLDQRGWTRPTDGDDIPGAICDLGAVEYQPSGEPFIISFDGFESGDTTGWSSTSP